MSQEQQRHLRKKKIKNIENSQNLDIPADIDHTTYFPGGCISFLPGFFEQETQIAGITPVSYTHLTLPTTPNV